MKSPSISVPEIQKEIKDNHNKFMSEYSSFIDKAISDNQFLADSAMAKINLIAVCLKREKVIDRIDMKDRGPIKEMCIFKTGCGNYIQISTNGQSILLEGYGYSTNDFASDLSKAKTNIRDISDESYDWKLFTGKLLDFIHYVIYEKAKAEEIRLDNALYGQSNTDKNDLVIKKYR